MSYPSYVGYHTLSVVSWNCSHQFETRKRKKLSRQMRVLRCSYSIAAATVFGWRWLELFWLNFDNHVKTKRRGSSKKYYFEWEWFLYLALAIWKYNFARFLLREIRNQIVNDCGCGGWSILQWSIGSNAAIIIEFNAFPFQKTKIYYWFIIGMWPVVRGFGKFGKRSEESKHAGEILTEWMCIELHPT